MVPGSKSAAARCRLPDRNPVSVDGFIVEQQGLGILDGKHQEAAFHTRLAPPP